MMSDIIKTARHTVERSGWRGDQGRQLRHPLQANSSICGVRESAAALKPDAEHNKPVIDKVITFGQAKDALT